MNNDLVIRSLWQLAHLLANYADKVIGKSEAIFTVSYPIIITVPTGTGKSWLASALGHHACLCGFKVRYYNIMKLFEELTMARIESRLQKLFERLSQFDLLILDDFVTSKL